MMVLVQSSVRTTWGSLFEIELEPNLLDWNVNELECKQELEDMKRTMVCLKAEESEDNWALGSFLVQNKTRKKNPDETQCLESWWLDL